MLIPDLVHPVFYQLRCRLSLRYYVGSEYRNDHSASAQYPDYPVYHRGPYDHRYSLAELTPVSNHQSHLVLIIRGNSRELYPDHDITDRLCIITPLQLTGIQPRCLLRSVIEPTTKPHFLTKAGVTVLTWAPLSIRAGTGSPSIRV